MGEVSWAAYSPESINWQARARVEELSQPRPDIVLNQKSTHRVGSVSGVLFFLGMLIILAQTLVIFR